MNDILNTISTRDIAEPSTYISAIFISFICSLIINEIYKIGYLRSNVGSGINRFFVIGGPSITALLIAIQFSLPLSLGLLGALSIVRFRTPIKDPQEIGYILALIAMSVSCATLNYIIVFTIIILLITIVFSQNTLKNFIKLKRGRFYHISMKVFGPIKDEKIREIFLQYFTEAELMNFRLSDDDVSILAQSSRITPQNLDSLVSNLRSLPEIKSVSQNIYSDE